jgi:prepilin-type N-terminal cleavage/methylation domain-containing protein
LNLFNTQSDPTKKPLFKKVFGFTLIEVLVAMSVIAIVSGMVFTQRQAFNRSVGLNNVAQEVALAIRQTQNYGVSSRGSSLIDPIDEFAYGIYFDAGSDPEQFTIYRDSGGNKGYNAADTDIEVYNLPAGVLVAGICTGESFGDTNCSPNNSEIVIRFSRPHPDAEFLRPNSGNDFAGNPETAVILLEDEESGSTRRVIIRRSGFITVE